MIIYLRSKYPYITRIRLYYYVGKCVLKYIIKNKYIPKSLYRTKPNHDLILDFVNETREYQSRCRLNFLV